jgi:hypothetical protein
MAHRLMPVLRPCCDANHKKTLYDLMGGFRRQPRQFVLATAAQRRSKMAGDRWRQPRTTSERRSEPWSRPPSAPRALLFLGGTFRNWCVPRRSARQKTREQQKNRERMTTMTSSDNQMNATWSPSETDYTPRHMETILVGVATDCSSRSMPIGH